MYFVPLSQLESVELLVHSLRAAAGEADCSQCPVRKVCMKQCLAIADSVDKMLQGGTLPYIGDDGEEAGDDLSIVESDSDLDPEPPPAGPTGPRLKLVK